MLFMAPEHRHTSTQHHCSYNMIFLNHFKQELSTHSRSPLLMQVCGAAGGRAHNRPLLKQRSNANSCKSVQSVQSESSHCVSPTALKAAPSHPPPFDTQP